MNCDIMLYFVFCIISIELLTLKNFNTLTHFNSEKKSLFLKTKGLCCCCGSISHVRQTRKSTNVTGSSVITADLESKKIT